MMNSQTFDFGKEPETPTKKVFLFADERKKVSDRWEYHCILIIEENYFDKFAKDLMSDRDQVKYYREMKFSDINNKGIGEKYELAKKWITRLILEASEQDSGVYFTVCGIDRDKIDFSRFGDGDSSEGKYANLYNRFFRATIIGALHLYFPNHNVIVKQLYHDQQGHLEEHKYFEWHIAKKITEETNDISFENDHVVFVCSDHDKEEKDKVASHCIQFVDILIGAITYCLHITNRKHKGQKKVAEAILPLLQEILYRGVRKPMSFNTYRKFTVSNFPVDSIIKEDIPFRKGDYFQPSCKAFEDFLSKQEDLVGLFD